MKQAFPDIWQWSWFSEEKQIEFNGAFMTVGEHRVLVDPPPMTAEDMTHVRRAGQVDYIIITNRDHEREAETYRKEFGCRVLVPELDAPEMAITADQTYKDGELLPGGMWVVHLKDQKSPGECGLFLERGKGIMILGDALIGKPAGALSMLPPDKYADPDKARAGLRRLMNYNFDTLLVGDGTSVLTGAKNIVARTLQPQP